MYRHFFLHFTKYCPFHQTDTPMDLHTSPIEQFHIARMSHSTEFRNLTIVPGLKRSQFIYGFIFFISTLTLKDNFKFILFFLKVS